MKMTLFIILAFVLVGCSTTNSIVQHVDQDVLKTADTIWKQRDCRAGVIQAITESRQVKSVTADKVQAFGDPKSDSYQRCYYLTLVANLYLTTADNLMPDIVKMIDLMQ